MRIFVAIEINDKNVLDSISKIQSELKINAKPVKIQNLHFTVQFLGEVSDQMVEKISRELCDLEFTPFPISFSGVGVFPKPNNPRVVWVGTNDGISKLEELVDDIQKKLSCFGFSPDKKFKPHVTIFRIKNKIGDITNELEKLSSHYFGKQMISEVKLKKSELTSNGPIYTDLLVVKGRK